MRQIAGLEAARDAVVAREAASSGEAEAMIRSLVRLKGIGAELATLLVWAAYVRAFPNREALGAYAGLTGTPFASGGREREREQGVSKAGSRRLRAALVESSWPGGGCAISRRADWPHGSGAVPAVPAGAGAR